MTKKISFFKILVWAAGLFTLGMLLFIVGYIFYNGIPHLSASMFEWDYTTDNVSMMPSIISTLIIIGASLLIAGPVGIFTGFYLVE